MDYNCVIKTIKVTNEEGIWDSDEALAYINKEYDIKSLPYGQVIHVWNMNSSGDEWNEYYVVYNGEIVYTQGDQYFCLHHEFTKNITDICAKYPEYCITTEKLGCCLPTELESNEDEYQQMMGFISAKDKLVIDNKIEAEGESVDTDDIVEAMLRQKIARGRWTVIRSCMKFLSLHKRGVIRANHPEAKRLRGEFEICD